MGAGYLVLKKKTTRYRGQRIYKRKMRTRWIGQKMRSDS
jgi:hypothetical protein